MILSKPRLFVSCNVGHGRFPYQVNRLRDTGVTPVGCKAMGSEEGGLLKDVLNAVVAITVIAAKASRCCSMTAAASTAAACSMSITHTNKHYAACSLPLVLTSPWHVCCCCHHPLPACLLPSGLVMGPARLTPFALAQLRIVESLWHTTASLAPSKWQAL